MDRLDRMLTFVRLCEGKSLSSAARARRLSLAAVSRQLTALEAELGTTLVVRSTRRLHVTEAGRRWYEHCVRILRELDEARAEVSGEQAARGTLVVSASLTFGTFFIVPMLKTLSERHPELTIELRLEDQLVDIVAEGVDLAVRAGAPPQDSPAFIAHPLFSMQRSLVASPAYLRKHGTPKHPSDLARHICLAQLTPAGLLIRWKLEHAGATHELAPGLHGPLRTNAPLALRDAARMGLGIAYLPQWLTAADVQAGGLRHVLPQWSSPALGAWAIQRTALRGAPRVRAFITLLRESSARLLG